MHALFEEAGKFQAGRILSEADSSAQIELDSGKRVKVKAANVLLKFEKPSPAEMLAKARELAATMELDLAWEFAPEDEFGFADLVSFLYPLFGYLSFGFTCALVWQFCRDRRSR